LLIAATQTDGARVKKKYSQFKHHLIITPQSLPSGVRVGEYVWTPRASKLPASLRMEIRGALSSLIDEESVEETFPETLLSW
jgi:hypothetical protein